MKGFYIYLELALCVFLIFLTYLHIQARIPKIEIKEEACPYYKYYALLKSLRPFLVEYIDSGKLYLIDDLLEGALDKEVSVDILIYTPVRVTNYFNETKNCVLGIVYNFCNGTNFNTIRIEKEGALRTMIRKNWRKKIIKINASKGCFKLDLSFPAGMNTSCLRVFWKGYPLKIGYNGSLLVCSPVNLTNDIIDIYYCLGYTVAQPQLTNITANESATWGEISDTEADIGEAYFLASIPPGPNLFYLVYGIGNLPLFSNYSLKVNCSMPIYVPEYSCKAERGKIIEGKRFSIAVPFSKGVAVLYITI